jgi:hypothetical protein
VLVFESAQVQRKEPEFVSVISGENDASVVWKRIVVWAWSEPDTMDQTNTKRRVTAILLSSLAFADSFSIVPRLSHLTKASNNPGDYGRAIRYESGKRT